MGLPDHENIQKAPLGLAEFSTVLKIQICKVKFC